MENYAPPSAEQKAFNEVWKRFVIEKHPPGLTETGSTVWKGHNETRCAIGWLMPNSLFSGINTRTNQSVIGIRESKSKLATYFRDTYSIDFLKRLESAHDLSVRAAKYPIDEVDKIDEVDEKEFHCNIESKLRKVAEDWSLKIPGKD